MRVNIKRSVLVLALVGSLTGPLAACGDNTNVERGQTNCDEQGQQANNPQDASCKKTGENPGNSNP